MLRRRLYGGLLPLLTLLVVLNVVVVLQIRSLDDTFERIQAENFHGILSLRSVSLEASKLTMASIFARNGLEDQALLTAREALAALREQMETLGAGTREQAERDIVAACSSKPTPWTGSSPASWKQARERRSPRRCRIM
jgi:hypothetical protein